MHDTGCLGREERSGWGTHVYLWRIHFNIWQNQYNIVKFKNKIKLKKKKNMRMVLLESIDSQLMYLFLSALTNTSKIDAD